MIEGISIRRLGPDDVLAFRAIRLEALERHPEAFQSAYRDEAADPLDRLADRLGRSMVFGASDGSGLVGMAGYFVVQGEKVRHKGVLWGMYVRAEARGRGIGAGLVEHVVAHAREHVEILGLSVITENPGARRLYERLGFVAYGIEPRAMKQDGTYVDEVLMAKTLR
ncbi:MAG: GNAT family N-acetyltransferase [Alphaproteobacteria bacterium]|nr:GNAT family N-acetyltransferase [Alphaproteobacteria bacterium]